MPKRKELTAEELARKEFAAGFIKSADIKDPADLQSMMKEIMRQVARCSLKGELDEELGYTRYDYRDKEQRTTGTDIPRKPCIPIWVTWRYPYPVTETAISRPG